MIYVATIVGIGATLVPFGVLILGALLAAWCVHTGRLPRWSHGDGYSDRSGSGNGSGVRLRLRRRPWRWRRPARAGGRVDDE